MSEDQDLLQIGEFARLAESNLRTIRYYEELGLLTPASRSSGGFRYYRHDQLDRMVAIKRLQDLGLSLKEIAETVVGDVHELTEFVKVATGLGKRFHQLAERL